MSAGFAAAFQQNCSKAKQKWDGGEGCGFLKEKSSALLCVESSEIESECLRWSLQQADKFLYSCEENQIHQNVKYRRYVVFNDISFSQIFISMTKWFFLAFPRTISNKIPYMQLVITTNQQREVTSFKKSYITVPQMQNGLLLSRWRPCLTVCVFI